MSGLLAVVFDMDVLLDTERLYTGRRSNRRTFGRPSTGR
jgi:hypothetical protein